MSTIDKLRETLFDTLEGVKNGTVKPDQAKAVVCVADALIDTAKVEVDYLRVTGGKGATGFIPAQLPHHTPTGTKTVDGNVTKHRLD